VKSFSVVSGVRRLKENSDVGRALAAEEERRILDAASVNQSPLIYPFLVTLTWIGLRSDSDEARRLRWHQLDFETVEVVVHKSKTEAGEPRYPDDWRLESGARTTRSLLPEIIRPDRAGVLRLPEMRDEAAPGTVGLLKQGWNSVRKAAGVSCRLHDLGRSFCTKLGGGRGTGISDA